MNSATDNCQTWKWVALFTAAMVLPLFLAPMFAEATGYRIQSVVTRLMTVFVVIVSIAKIGVTRVPEGLGRSIRTMLLAMLLTIGLCGLYTVGLILAGAEWLRPWDEIFQPTRLITALGTGIAVSVIEEPIFRRFLLGKLSFRGSVVAGAILSSSLYALIHYVRPSKVPIQSEYTLADSWNVYENILTNLLKPLSDPSPGFGLLLFGLVLCVVVRRGGLAWTIGIHAGVVYYLKADTCLIYWGPQGRHPVFGSFEALYEGTLFWIVCTCILVALLVFEFASRRGSRPSVPADDVPVQNSQSSSISRQSESSSR